MKKVTLILFSFVLTALSCSNDDDSQPENRFTVDTKTYSLATGSIGNLSENMGVYQKAINLYSDGVSFDGTDFSGTGELLSFFINSGNETNSSGEYIYSEGSMNANEIYFATYSIAKDFDDLGGAPYTGIEFGTLSIEQNGNSYQLTFAGRDENGYDVNVFYSGTFAEYP